MVVRWPKWLCCRCKCSASGRHLGLQIRACPVGSLTGGPANRLLCHRCLSQLSDCLSPVYIALHHHHDTIANHLLASDFAAIMLPWTYNRSICKIAKQVCSTLSHSLTHPTAFLAFVAIQIMAESVADSKPKNDCVFFLLRNLLQQSRNQSITCRRFWFWWLLTTKRSDIFNYQGVETMATGYPSIHTKPTHSDQPNYTVSLHSVCPCVGELVTRLVSLYRVSHEFMVSWTIKMY